MCDLADFERGQIASAWLTRASVTKPGEPFKGISIDGDERLNKIW